MKKRKLARRRGRFAPRVSALDGIFTRATRKRRAFTFERLEERYYFSATPWTYQPGMNGLLTEEQVTFGELFWAVKQAGDLGQYDSEALATTTDWVVLTAQGADGSGASLEDPNSLPSLVQIDTTGMTTDQVVSALSSSNNVLGFYPLAPLSSQSTHATAMIDEPLFPYQWHLQNRGDINIGNPNYQTILGTPGEDINVVDAWSRGITGRGVTVAVADSGIQMNHPDLISNLNFPLSFDFLDNDSNVTPPTVDAAQAHGTAVAGIIGAVGTNGVGGTGIAPNASLVGLRIFDDTTGANIIGDDFALSQLFSYLNQDIDVFNHSWRMDGNGREVAPMGPLALGAIRSSVLFGREVNGVDKGVIHVFASGNEGGDDGTDVGFPRPGFWDSAEYSGNLNRYVITVGGVDHDGAYENDDGSFTNYMENGANVLVVAPTGSFLLNIGIDEGVGSGIFTTDLTGSGGFNTAGDFDNDYLSDAIIPNGLDYTSRFNGTSAAAPMVSGVVALMLQANPELSYRDVQEILIRSARSADPTNEGWEVNYREVFQDPGPFFLLPPVEDPFVRLDNPTNAVTFPGGFGFPSNLPGLLPIDDYAVFGLPKLTNGAGYSTNYGIGIFEEQTGFAHGVVDAELAVKLAQQWHVHGQALPREETTYTTFYRPMGGTTGVIFASARVGPDADPDFFIVPGSWGDGNREFAAYYDEFFADMPFSGDDPPINDRGFIGGSSMSALPLLGLEGFEPTLMDIEWIEVKVEIDGGADAMNQVRLALKSPDGTISDLNHFLRQDTSLSMNWTDRGLIVGGATSPAGAGSPFVWTYSTNRHWGERTDAYIEVSPVPDQAGDAQYRVDPNGLYLDVSNPLGGVPGILGGGEISHHWELIAENYGTTNVTVNAFEVVFHGTPLSTVTEVATGQEFNSERIQGRIGIDIDQDGDFNWDREIKIDTNGDGVVDVLDDYSNHNPGPPGTPGLPGPPTYDLDGDGIVDARELDTTDTAKEPYGSNIVVQAFLAGTNTMVAEFVTGADGNYYFDLAPRDLDGDGFLDPTDYDIRLGATSLAAEGVAAKDDGVNLNPRYLQEWTVTIDPNDLFTRNSGRRVMIDNDRDGLHDFNDVNGDGFPDPDELLYRYVEYRDVNFLLDQGPPPANSATIRGFVFADRNADGNFADPDTRQDGFTVFADLDRDGVHDIDSEPFDIIESGNNGEFTLVVPVSVPTSVDLIAKTSLVGWTATKPVQGKTSQLIGPGSEITGVQFGFKPPAVDNPNPEPPPDNGGQPVPGAILGTVYEDENSNGVRDAAEEGLSGYLVFADLDLDGVLDDGEVSDTTDINGVYSLTTPPGAIRVRVIAPEPLNWAFTSPTSGFIAVNLGSGGTVSNVSFGVRNLATRDFGDLPDSYSTLEGSGGPSHTIVPGFQLGSRIDGEVNGQPSPFASADDVVDDEDGVQIVSNNGVLKPGTNILRVVTSGSGGLLTGWIDWNHSGNFDPSEKLIWKDPLGNLVSEVQLNTGTWFLEITAPSNAVDGPIFARFRWGLNGLSFTGPAPSGEVEDYRFGFVYSLSGDFNRDGTVDQLDKAIWQATFGSTTDLRADANDDGVVDTGDYVEWRAQAGIAGAAGLAAGGSNPSVSSSSSPAASVQAPASSGGSSPISLLAFLAQSGGSVANSAGSPSTGQAPADHGVADAGTDAPSASTVSPPAALGSLSDGPIVSGLVASFDSSVIHVVSPEITVLGGESAASTAPAASSSLLLDQALANFDSEDVSDDDDSLVAPMRNDDEEHTSDLALAAVLEDDSHWWSL